LTRRSSYLFLFTLIYLITSFALSRYIGVNIFQTTFNSYGTFDDFENLLKVPSLFEFSDKYLGVTPFTVMFYRQLNRVDLYFNLPIFLGINVLILMFLLLCISRKIREIVFLFLISWPLIFLISRGNNDFIILNLLIAAILLFQRTSLLSAFLLGIAVSIDPTFIFGILFLGKIHLFRKLIIVVFTFVILNCTYPYYLGILNKAFLEQYLNQLFIYWQKMVIQGDGSLFSNSIDFGFYSFTYLIPLEINSNLFITSIQIILILSFTLGTVLYYRSKKIESYLIIGLSTTFYLLIFSPSPDYKLVFLLLPLLSYLHNSKELLNTPTEFYLISLIWLPKHFFYFGATLTFAGYSLSSFFNATLILILFMIYLKLIVQIYLSETYTKNLNPDSSK
jgi:hypothetical protein